MISNLNHTNIANCNANTSESFDDLPTDFTLRIAAGLLSYFSSCNVNRKCDLRTSHGNAQKTTHFIS